MDCFSAYFINLSVNNTLFFKKSWLPCLVYSPDLQPKHLPFFSLPPLIISHSPFNRLRLLSTEVGREKVNNNKNKVDYSIFRLLGLDPKKVVLHSVFKNHPVSWTYVDSNFETISSVSALNLEILKDFIQKKIKPGRVYGVLPIIYNPMTRNDLTFIAISTQMDITAVTDPQALLNHLDLCYNVYLESYLDSSIDDCGGSEDVFCSMAKYIFKYRELSFKHNDYVMVNKRYVKDPYKKALKNNFDFYHPRELPLTHNKSDYGLLTDYENSMELYVNPNDADIQILIKSEKYMEKTLVRDLEILRNGKTYLFCTDTITPNNVFYRKIPYINTEYCIDNLNKTILYASKTIISKPLNKVLRDVVFDTKISVMDIECFVDKNKLYKPYACGWLKYDTTKYSKKIKSTPMLYYLTDFSNSDDMFFKCITDLIKSDPGTVYVHNLSKFDSFFILRLLYKHFKVKSTYKGRLILSMTITLREDNKSYKMVMKDSLLLLQGSLKALAKAYEVPTQKGYFPYHFPNQDNLNYVGNIPDYRYYSEMISLEEYNKYPKKYWNLKDETFKYLAGDLYSLHQILIKFADIIYNEERLNITKVSTTSSLVFKILKANHIKPYSIYQINGSSHTDMRNAYYGGRVDTFTPYGTSVNCYDVNSLYPLAMLRHMPIGQAIKTNDTELDNYFGVVYVEVETPKDKYGFYIELKYPPLPFKDDKGNLINPIGKWKSWYFSEELKDVRDNFGYKIKVIHGYKFKRGVNLFKNFVSKYYNIKAGFDLTTTIDRPTAKLLLNGGYGRFGTRLDSVQTKIIKKEDYSDIALRHEIVNDFELVDDIVLVEYKQKIKECFNEDEHINLSKDKFSVRDVEQSLPIAIATTAYSRMYMNMVINFLDKNGILILYSDTDSLWIKGELPSKLVGDLIGQFKLEFIAKEAYFLLPKVYYCTGIDSNNNIVEVKKCKGIKSGSLTREEYISLSKGYSIKKEDIRFIRNFTDQTIKFDKKEINIKPVNHKRRLVLVDNKLETKPLIVINNKINPNIDRSHALVVYKNNFKLVKRL